MARQIDTSDLSALSQEDLRYLRNRNRLTPAQESEFIDDSIDDSADDEELTYDQMSLKALGEEIDARNAELDEDDHLSKPKTKADRIAVLEADDEARAETED